MRKILTSLAVVLLAVACSKTDTTTYELPGGLPERFYCTTGEKYGSKSLYSEFHFLNTGKGTRTVYYEEFNIGDFSRDKITFGYFSFTWSVSGNTITVQNQDKNDCIADKAVLTVGENHHTYWDGTYNGKEVQFRLYDK